MHRQQPTTAQRETGSEARRTTARSQDYHYKDSMEIIIFSKSFKKYFFSPPNSDLCPYSDLARTERGKNIF